MDISDLHENHEQLLRTFGRDSTRIRCAATRGRGRGARLWRAITKNITLGTIP